MTDLYDLLQDHDWVFDWGTVSKPPILREPLFDENLPLRFRRLVIVNDFVREEEDDFDINFNPIEGATEKSIFFTSDDKEDFYNIRRAIKSILREYNRSIQDKVDYSIILGRTLEIGEKDRKYFGRWRLELRRTGRLDA